MRTRARALGHSIHPMLVSFPLGLLATAVIFDILYLITDKDGFTGAAAYTMAAGIIGGLVAGVFGIIDWTGLPKGSRARTIGTVHGVGNIIVLLLFAASWLLRIGPAGWTPPPLALVCSFAGAALAVITAWLGGELVERLGVSVDPDAGVNKPSSLARHQH